MKETKRKLLQFLIQAKQEGKKIVGYGAPGKGNTLLNYCGIRTDFIDYTVDRNPYKQGRFLPGTHIPIFHPENLRNTSGLRLHSSLELEKRNHAADVFYPRVGRQVHRSDSRSDDLLTKYRM